MSTHIYILDASGNLNSLKDTLRKHARLAIRKVKRRIDLDSIDIVIRESESPELFRDIDGIAGSCPSGNFMQISIDIDHPSFRISPGKLVQKTLIHELHHAARMQAGILMNKGTFLEYMFSEGLADHFLYELTGETGKWIIDLDTGDKTRLLREAKRKYSDSFSTQDHIDWFIRGSEKERIPQFAGYTIGFEIVGDFIRKNPDKSSASLVKTPVEEIMLLS